MSAFGAKSCLVLMTKELPLQLISAPLTTLPSFSILIELFWILTPSLLKLSLTTTFLAVAVVDLFVIVMVYSPVSPGLNVTLFEDFLIASFGLSKETSLLSSTQSSGFFWLLACALAVLRTF